MQSFSHIYWLGAAHGQDRLDSALLPLSVDGLIMASSLVLLHGARTRLGSPPLAYLSLWLGIGATIGANAAYGWPHGVLGVAASTWPALSFVLAVHVALGMVRRMTKNQPAAVTRVAHDAEQAALRATVAAGNPLSGRQLAERFGLNRAQVAQVRSTVLSETNGHG